MAERTGLYDVLKVKRLHSQAYSSRTWNWKGMAIHHDTVKHRMVSFANGRSLDLDSNWLIRFPFAIRCDDGTCVTVSSGETSSRFMTGTIASLPIFY